ncbi:MAG TPA: tetraacyldisaccharide 4'-kinase [Tepidisphaeraceae bacterium]|jgi:tetraacyldisaccharide 4'-kinase
MKQSTDAHFKQVMDGSDRSIGASVLRIAASCAEPIYAAIMHVRNGLYDAGILRAHRLGRPTISVGNITTGGTGKTPVVRWLAASLKDQRPCILLRGYKSTAAGLSDEQALLASGGVPVIADGDRRRGAVRALKEHPETSIFILDDGMQHRRVARDFEIVLINAREPFGGGRIFPRGMLREPLSGLRRADAVVITHADEVDAEEMAKISGVIRKHNEHAAILRADHVIAELLGAGGESMPIQSLMGKRYFAFCGLGSPASFFWRLETAGGACVGTREFGDHFDYRQSDIEGIAREAAGAGAEMLVVTEKDWVKLSKMTSGVSLPIWRAELSLRFWADDEQKLLKMVGEKLGGKIVPH